MIAFLDVQIPIGEHGVKFLIALLVILFVPQGSFAFTAKDAADIGAAFMTHLTLHELGHQVVADDVGAESPKMEFFKFRNGKFYPGLSTYTNIDPDSKLPYAVGGERMAGYTFEYALQDYRKKPTTYNKALLFFSCTDFLWYTIYAFYLTPGNDMYDPTIIQQETGLSKGLLFSLVFLKTAINAARVTHKDFNLIPIIYVDRTSATFALRICF